MHASVQRRQRAYGSASYVTAAVSGGIYRGKIYQLGKYISIEKIIGQTKETYYEMLRQCPDVSEVTVQRTLAELLQNGDIIKIGGGRYTHYVWNREKDE